MKPFYGNVVLILNINREGDNVSEKNEKVINLKDKIVEGSKKAVDVAQKLNPIIPITDLGKDFLKTLRYGRGLDSKNLQEMMNKAETEEERQAIRDFELKKSRGRNITMLGGITLLGVIGIGALAFSEKFSQPSVN